MARGILLLLTVALAIPRPAAACGGRCDAPGAKIAYPRTGITVPSDVEVVVQWHGLTQWFNPDPIPLESIELRTDAGELVPVTYVREAWANGTSSTLLVRPADSLPAGVYKVVRGAFPFEAEETLLSTFVVEDASASAPPSLAGAAVNVADERLCAIRELGPPCCYGDEAHYRRIDLDLPEDVTTVSIEENGILHASHASTRQAWGIAIDNLAALDTCRNDYYPWLVTPGGHNLVITPFAADGTRGEPIERTAVATVGGGCSLASRGAPPSWPLLLLAAMLLFLRRRIT